ncbi:hypothetical protein PHYBLDRAFT_70971 [Phycomyces blakesleeanus NRRL 1555(-)]|uniref:Uncharacterized protein n=1 Tax=Phycomyces blakesleeanus (strain ATCC 8743b / DSM 1359 / FGSC 10004 / NBRC 33097 / NRRL 1555) TaxID=763407 RepID=A0A162TD73_PHYB8|nr:hypothetical protein PHYBLDRAFT_70971 [Phycomyces blakesleeanus NRRL 1555(-)]OAD66193.1 hypothetical protein PHYBLDRAFT_70971 [Phycomyces blakesleeanus NRRL 1555(-)]|eukprot:XP_018284233.1 hypothetical protein PHYBLDRAFT_70971 [Phycomyces blakesleeanus NRRL 1555(-)]
MAPIRKPTVRKECQCSISHEDTCNTISSTVSEPVNQEEDSFEFEQNLNDLNAILDIQTINQPFSETNCVFGPEDNVQYTSDTYEEEEYEDESDVGIDNDEDSLLELISELNLIHQFIIISVAIFVSLYIIDEGAVILIAIINKILQFLFDPFRLPVSVAGLKHLSGFEALTSGVKKYVACSKCHAIYDNEAAPLCCTSPNFDKTSLCGNSLFKSGPRSKVSKKTYIVDVDDIPFVDTEQSLILMLNIDWFQPFDGVTYSCDAIYLAINNLPRTLLMAACDIPAARKVCGFTSNTTTNACHKCKCQFLRLAGTSSIDHSGFDFSKWLLRTKNDNRKDAEIWRNATKPTERQRLEVAHGVCWSELHRLQYFDIVCCTIIDPMHNLFLGTAKRMLERWVADGLIDDKKLVVMQKTVEKSPVVLRDVLPLPEFKNWIEFINSCRYFTKPSVSKEDVEKGHKCTAKKCPNSICNRFLGFLR